MISLNMVNLRCRKRSVAEFMQESIVFLVRVQCRRKESSRSLSHILMSFLYNNDNTRVKVQNRQDNKAAFKLH